MLSRCLRALLFVPTVATALHAQSSKITTYVRYAVDGQTSYGRVVGTTVQQLRAAQRSCAATLKQSKAFFLQRQRSTWRGTCAARHP